MCNAHQLQRVPPGPVHRARRRSVQLMGATLSIVCIVEIGATAIHNAMNAKNFGARSVVPQSRPYNYRNADHR
jgi:hypothetical protein